METNYSLARLLKYFLRLGLLGFGGPVALVAYMQGHLVHDRKWFSEIEYNEGFAFAQLSPGPLATQLAMYLGWIRAGMLGATLAGGVFILPSFVMVVVLAALYLQFGDLPWIQAVFYSVSAAVIGIIAKSAIQLTKKTIHKDWLLWVIFSVSAAVTVITESELIWIFALAGLVTMIVRSPPNFSKRAYLCTALIPFWMFTGLKGPASSSTFARLGFYFAKVGTIVFGSGLAIVPFLHGGVVQQFHWLTERQFLDSIAIGMITPGPVVIASGFIGYFVGGVLGAGVAALGVFLPAYLFVIILAPHYRRLTQIQQVRTFVSGVTAAAIGGIAGASIILGKRAIIDIPTALIAVSVFLVLLKTKKVPEPILIIVAAIAGLLVKGGVI